MILSRAGLRTPDLFLFFLENLGTPYVETNFILVLPPFIRQGVMN